MERTILTKDFYDRATLVVARELLGKYLVRKWRGKEYAYMITEVEAYDGVADKASHASRGRTARTEIMFGDPGIWYIYLIYGMYSMLNVVTREKEYPAAVLIRGVEGVSGPGRLTAALHISRSLNGRLAGVHSGLWIEDRGVRVSRSQIIKAPRVGVSYAGEAWSAKPWRFMLKTSIM